MDVEQRARELLARCLDEWGRPCEAGNVREGEDLESYESELRLLSQLLCFGLDTADGHGRAALTPPEGHVVVTRNEAGQAVAVTRQDDEGRILSVIAEFESPKGDMGNPISVPDGFVLVPVEPTEAMIDAGRAAVMAEHCAGPKWTPRQHFEASGRSIAGIPEDVLDERGPLTKESTAAMVFGAMLAARPEVPDGRG